MKRYFTTLLDVFERVILFCLDPLNVAVTNSIQALQTGINNTLSSKVAAIKALIYSQSQKNQGYAAQKTLYKKVAANLMMVIVNGAKGFAKGTGDEILYGKINYSYRTLLGLKDNEFVDILNGILNLLTPMQGNLVNYGVVAQDFTNATNAIALYGTMEQAPRNQIEQKRAVNRLLDGLFKDTNDFVRFVLDHIVFTLKDSQQQYYQGYRAARKHVPHGLRHNRINAVVQDELGEPFVGVQVTVDEYTDPDTGKTYHAVSGNTDINGMVTVEDFWPGNREVQVSGPGIITKKFGPFNFKEGTGINQVFTMQPDFANLPTPQTTEEKEKANK